MSTFQADEKITSTVNESEETNIFRTKPGPLIKFVKKEGHQ